MLLQPVGARPGTVHPPTATNARSLVTTLRGDGLHGDDHEHERRHSRQRKVYSCSQHGRRNVRSCVPLVGFIGTNAHSNYSWWRRPRRR